MEWVRVAIAAVSALCGGFVGGWVVAFRVGRWREGVEQRLAAHDTHLTQVDRRLAKGAVRIDDVPVLAAKLDTIVEEVRALRGEFREDIRLLVTREECDRRHERDA